MKFGRRQLLRVAVAAALFALAALYARLPDRASTYWEASQAFPFLVILVVGLLVFVAEPRMLRRAFSIESSESASERRFGRIQPLSTGLVVVSFVLAVVVYGRRADGMPAPYDVFIFPSVVCSFWLYSLVLPRISSRVGAAHVGRTNERMEAAVLGVLCLAGIARLGVFAPPMRAMNVAGLVLGALFILGGNVMGKMQQNYFGGIRTPWTLGNPEVWLRTQRVGGKVTMLAGALLIVATLTGTLRQWQMPIMASAVVIPMAYSYFLSRRLEGTKAG
jgi:uncharacterized membrane protein